MEKKSTSELNANKRKQRKTSIAKNSASRKDVHQYKCGDPTCGKYYHSYTAFYNHCKKSHNGSFPENSFYNGQLFEGPSKNRGRPRIKKTQAKDQAQIQSLKTQNELIELIGTLPKKKKYEEIIVYVANPIDHLLQAIRLAEAETDEGEEYFRELIQLNEIIAENDLPDFYDPVEIKLYADRVDSYNFTSVYFFLAKYLKVSPSNEIVFDQRLMCKSLIIWLARNISTVVLAEIIYIVFQMQNKTKQPLSINDKHYFFNKVNKFKGLFLKYFECITNEYNQTVNQKERQQSVKLENDQMGEDGRDENQEDEEEQEYEYEGPERMMDDEDDSSKILR